MAKKPAWADAAKDSVKESVKQAAIGAEQQGLNQAEIEYRKATMTTRGVKGAKNPHLHIIVSPDNDEFLRTMAPIMGMTVTGLINHLIDDYRMKNQELMETIQAQRDKFKY